MSAHKTERVVWEGSCPQTTAECRVVQVGDLIVFESKSRCDSMGVKSWQIMQPSDAGWRRVLGDLLIKLDSLDCGGKNVCA